MDRFSNPITHITARKLLSTLLIIAMLATATWQLGRAGYIHVKAQLAQYLIAAAWEQSLEQPETIFPPWQWADTWPVARIIVPRLDIDQYVLANASGQALAFGPGMLSRTSTTETKIVSGHRDTHFRFLKDIQLDDQLHLQDTSGVWQRFRVSHIQIMDTTQQSLRVGNTEGLVLITCYPFSALQAGGPLRYTVSLRRIQPLLTDST
ncbi:class GN sortase [Parendozoicomonas sp. Alg238-R29]|uniref:class GN sortase n=1 Tax=Parendozoicomonas sp. Alg238-R29 TaxID=2993446 RepID=UPI00248D410A|nr:class GN sortase [Parendozoicomonas sp. Alg238-R29]